MDQQANLNAQIEQTIRDFLVAQRTMIPAGEFLVNILLAALMGAVLGVLYSRFGISFTNRRQFSKNFVLLAMATMLIISIVKSSLALSLGLVGALSIVRFRAAIKDPEELIFLFLSIAIGLGMGANQVAVTGLGFLAISAVIVARGYARYSEENCDLCLAITVPKRLKLDLEEVTGLLSKHCSMVSVKRIEEDERVQDLAFVIGVDTFRDLAELKKDLSAMNGVSRLVILDNKGVQV